MGGAGTDRAAWRGSVAIGAAVAAVEIGFAGRYGPHRDELYFLRVGADPAWGYPDQPPLTPLLAHALDVVSGGSLVGLRVVPALLAGLVVIVTGLIAREFGAPPRAQLVAAASSAVAAIVLIAGHTVSTTIVDLAVWSVLSLLVVRALRDGGRIWLAVGLVAGIGLQNKLQPALLLGALLVGVLAVGPRAALRSVWPWLGGLVALAIWAPNLAWQATHGFPLLSVAGSIAAGNSASSTPPYLFPLYLLVLVSPLLVPVWAQGWWRLLRDPALAPWRTFAPASALLVVLFVATSGKPYYVAGFFPVLLAAGAEPVLRWAGRTTVAVALGLSLAVNAVLMLPVLPPSALGVVNAVNPDAGETVGWPRFADTVAAVRATVPDARVVVLGRNYGEAGAVDRYLPALTPAYSGQNAYFDLGPPPDDVTAVVVVGYQEPDVRRWFADATLATRIDNGVGLDNEEQGEPVWVARGPRGGWATVWPQLRRLG